jgi:hypothetical protein
MVSQSANETVSRANSYKTCEVGMCLKYVRTWLGIGSREASAIDAWNAAKVKHPNDQKPPRGAPVFWKGGQYGHIALAIDNDNGRSTDTTSSGKVGTQNGNWWKNNWGYQYLGWTEDVNGVTIPYLAGGGGGSSEWASGPVYVSKLHQGQKDSDSVSRLRYRLVHHNQIPNSHDPGLGNDYGQEVLEAVRYWQRNVAPQVNGPSDGTSLSNPQANTLFGDAYTVHEK